MKFEDLETEQQEAVATIDREIRMYLNCPSCEGPNHDGDTATDQYGNKCPGILTDYELQDYLDCPSEWLFLWSNQHSQDCSWVRESIDWLKYLKIL